MSLYLNTNMSSIRSQRSLSSANDKVDVSYERLSSGVKINSAKDDAAGLQITNRMTTQINGLTRGNRIAQDGISLAQTAEGAMDEISTMLQRIRTLALQSANGTNSSDDREALQMEVNQLCEEIDRISNDTTFGGKKILNGECDLSVTDGKIDIKVDNTAQREKNLKFQISSNTSQIIDIDLNLRSSKEYEYTLANTTDTTAYKDNLNLGYSIASMFLAIGCDESNIKDVSSADRNTGFMVDDGQLVFDISNVNSSEKVLENIDKFISRIDNKRADLGAMQNRLESTIRSQENISQNMSDSKSRILDTDYAEETAKLATQNVLLQASQSMLSQANTRPQVALSLLSER
ncbi:MAG: flagellin [Succinivibrionaceae bacterium]